MKLNIPYDDSGSLRTGRATINNISEQHLSISVLVDTLDRFMFKDVVFIKVDVEGYESNVLRGAYNTIRSNKPILLVEIEQRHLNKLNNSITVQQVIKSLTNWGYSCFYYENSRMCPVDVDNFKIEDFQCNVSFEEWNMKPYKRYINNFFFIPLNSTSS